MNRAPPLHFRAEIAVWHVHPNLVVECFDMPWQKTDPALERAKFIAALQDEPDVTFTDICARFGISRMAGYRWKRWPP